MFKKGLLILTLCLSMIGLSGCGKSSATDGVEFVNNLDVELREVTLSQAFIDWAASESRDTFSPDDESTSYFLNITNNTKYYLNNMPIGIIVDDEQLTLDDLMENEYETLDARLILAPGDTFSIELNDAKADSKVTLIPDYNEKYDFRGIEEDLTTDSDIEKLDAKFFDKYVTKESSEDMLYPADITIGKATYVKTSQESIGEIIPELEVEITNNTDKEASDVELKYTSPFFECVINGDECDGIASYIKTDDDEQLTFSLPANGTSTAKFIYIGPEDVDNITLQFHGLALK